MEQTKREQLLEAGIEVDSVLNRFMNNEALLFKFLGRFAQEPSMEQLRQALAAQDVDGAYAAAHTLKGVAGNLSMHALFEEASRMTELLKKRDLEGAAACMETLERAYDRVLTALRVDS